MKISNLIPAYLLPFSLFCQVLGAPTNGKRGNVVVVKVKTTVQQTQTDIQTISEATGTTTNYLINTSTETLPGILLLSLLPFMEFLILIPQLLLHQFLQLMLFLIAKMKLSPPYRKSRGTRNFNFFHLCRYYHNSCC